MGDTKKEEAKVEAKQEEEKKEVKAEENNEVKVEEKKEEVKPSPPTVLSVELHCVGCAKKIQRIILKFKGVEDVQVDMVNNQVTVKGAVDAQALCSTIKKKTFRQAVLISPLTPSAEADSKPEVAVEVQVSESATVELLVNMHCEACAEQLKKKILKMRGVQTAETNLTAPKVTVTGTMTGEKLVEYIYRRTGKLAKIIPPPPKQELSEKKPNEEKPAENKKDDNNAEKKEEEKPAEQKESAETNKENGEGAKEQKSRGENPKEVAIGDASYYIGNHENPDMMKRIMYWNGGMMNDHEIVNTMVPWMPAAPMMPMYINDRPSPFIIPEQSPPPLIFGRPPYVIGQPAPPPQFFSDENPNACCIS